MIKVIYDPNCGEAVSDGAAIPIAQSLANTALHTDGQISYSTANVFAALRFLIAANQADYRLIVFVYRGQEFQANTYGAIPNWPEGFCDFEVTMDEQILKVATRKKKEALDATNKQQHYLTGR